MGWVQDVVKCSYWGEDSSSDIGAFWIIKYLSSICRDMFLQVVFHLKIPIIEGKMNALSYLAMWSAANVSTSQQLIIQRHINSALGFRLIVPESKVTRMTKDRYVEPITGVYIDNNLNTKTFYWYRRLDEKICHSLQDFLNDSSINASKLGNLDIVIGGYHGKGKFRMLDKLVFECNEESHSVIRLIGFIDCKKIHMIS